MTHIAPYFMGEGVLVLVCGGDRGAGGGRVKGEFEQTEMPEQAGERPICFVLVTM